MSGWRPQLWIRVPYRGGQNALLTYGVDMNWAPRGVVIINGVCPRLPGTG
jgi:hypothetical protein